MEQHETPEAVAARADQEDPLVMYLVVRETLEMSIGKACAQCAHAAQMITLEYFKRTAQLNCGQNVDTKGLSLFEKWLDTSFRKVSLKADDKEWQKVKAQLEPSSFITVVDNGLTEIPAGSETVIGVWPMLKSERPKILKKLQVLK